MKNFQTNKKDFQFDEYAQEKLVTYKQVLAMMKTRIQYHAAESKENYHVTANAILGQTFRLMDKHFARLKSIVEKDAEFHSSGMTPVEQQNILNQYRQPGIDYFNKSVYPLFEHMAGEEVKDAAQDEEADWRIVPRTAIVTEADIGMANQSPEDELLEKQRHELEDMAALFAPLICLTPDRLSLEELRYYKKEYLQSAAFDKLRLTLEARVQQGQGPDGPSSSGSVNNPKVS